jgi:hypothetical protein
VLHPLVDRQTDLAHLIALEQGREIVAVTDHVEQLGDEFDLSVLAFLVG